MSLKLGRRHGLVRDVATRFEKASAYCSKARVGMRLQKLLKLFYNSALPMSQLGAYAANRGTNDIAMNFYGGTRPCNTTHLLPPVSFPLKLRTFQHISQLTATLSPEAV